MTIFIARARKGYAETGVKKYDTFCMLSITVNYLNQY
jgi:hypothetical protein